MTILLIWTRVFSLEEELKRAECSLSFARANAPRQVDFRQNVVINISEWIEEFKSAIVELGGSLDDRPKP